MCEIAGFCNFQTDYSCEQKKFVRILDTMAITLSAPPPNKKGTYLSRHIGLVHSQTIGPNQNNVELPIYRSVGGYTYAISYTGELYNRKELKEGLFKTGWRLKTNSDTELILLSYIEYGESVVQMLYGNFVFAIADERLGKLILYRSPQGTKPLFYTFLNDTFLFSSNIQAFLSISNLLEQEATMTTFKDHKEVSPGQYTCISSKTISTLTQKSEHSS